MKYISAVLLVVCCSLAMAQPVRISIIPKPLHAEEKPGVFLADESTMIITDPEYRDVAEMFAASVSMPAGNVRVLTRSQQAGSNAIVFAKRAADGLTDTSAYRLTVAPDIITIAAPTRTGMLNGMQSLTQLFLLTQRKGSIPCVNITDAPRFRYRGLMLDVSRNFYPISFVKKLIDLMALYKLNTFHWHLVDGAGWRLQINRYPLLTKQAAWRTGANWKQWRKEGGRYSSEGDPNAYGGYYTQQEAREVVQYAAKRGITVIPEIEMPGHSEEVLAAYPYLSCSGEPYRNSEYCLGNDATFNFLQDVLTEVMDIFPSTYIHMGGDEASRKAWKQCPKCQRRIANEQLKDENGLQSYAMKRIERFLQQHGRKLLGWDEILEGGIAPAATVMSWRGEAGGIAAAQEGHDVVMTPESYCYFDHYQDNPATQPEAFGGYLPTSMVYGYNPVPAVLDSVAAKHVIGVQANLWTEYIPTMEQAEYMLFPRAIALAENGWISLAQKNADDFHSRLYPHYGILQKKQVNYFRPSAQVIMQTTFDSAIRSATVRMHTERYQPGIHYTLDGTAPTIQSPLYEGELEVDSSVIVQAAYFTDSTRHDTLSRVEIDFHKALGKKVTYKIPPSKRYTARGDATLVNGYRGTYTYSDGQWQGFDTDIDFTIDLEKTDIVHFVTLNFQQLIGPGVYMPEYVEVSVSADSVNFSEPVKVLNQLTYDKRELQLQQYRAVLKGEPVRYIHVYAKNHKGFLFTDEVIVY
ncbi:beta-N-acetylhexosaminidase [Deminuibacter soli]|uniref:beta-N-acetylhexosaminidase n=1 Tax=Deminuibacter soli TaxID=2291815 RepID=A0A3E1NKN2_9BACT|nr:family 20 glycosylhydrolase [Deminuibacter soli]RFM28457.1 beta-N-acetylhexosaminidase [Deminuibacter soli]